MSTGLAEPNVRVQLVVLGNSAVGKSSIVQRFFNADVQIPNWHITTVGVDFIRKSVTLSDSSIAQATIWDTAGQEKYASITKNYYRCADGCFLVYDITDASSFDRIKSHWITEVKNSNEKNMKNFVLIGNKSDLKDNRAVSYADGEKLAKDLNCGFFETSTLLENSNITKAFMHLIEVTCRWKKYNPSIVKSRPVQVSSVPKQRSKSLDCCV